MTGRRSWAAARHWMGLDKPWGDMGMRSTDADLLEISEACHSFQHQIQHPFLVKNRYWKGGSCGTLIGFVPGEMLK